MGKKLKEGLILTKRVFFSCFIVMLFCCNGAVAQSKIDMTDINEMSDRQRQLHWTINGESFSSTDSNVIIYPNNLLDTIVFMEKRHFKTWFDTVYTRIPDHEELSMGIGCCDAGFDLCRKGDYEKYIQQWSEVPDSLQLSLYEQHLEYGTIQFKILNKPITDTLLCIYDHVFLLGQLITNDKDYGYIIPCRYAYANNILHISIVKYNFSGMYGYSLLEGEINANKWPCEKGVDIVGIEIKDKYENNTMTLKRFSVRMFNQEKVIIQYDYATGDLQVLFTNP